MQSTRRHWLQSAVGLAALAIAGCGRAQAPRPAAKPAMLVHRDPGCGCCLAWAEQAATAGYAVKVVDTAEIAAVKQRLGVPADLASCHTAQVDGLVIEGHVPFAALARLRAERPTGVIGLAVPGMPRGSPGMEMPDGTRDHFTVFAFAADGRRAAFAA
jgi:hypothetical protein